MSERRDEGGRCRRKKKNEGPSRHATMRLFSRVGAAAAAEDTRLLSPTGKSLGSENVRTGERILFSDSRARNSARVSSSDPGKRCGTRDVVVRKQEQAQEQKNKDREREKERK